jgi:hypothetical protein
MAGSAGGKLTMKKLALSILCLALSAATMLGIIEASREAHAGPSIALAQAGALVTIEPMPDAAPQDAVAASAPVEAGSAAVTVNAGSGSTVNVTAPAATPVPDPVEDTGGAIAALTKLYKDGALTPFFIVLGFFSLVYAERKVAWLRTGYRKVAVSSLLYGLGMLVERAITGTTPNLSMWVAAIGAALVFAFKSYGVKPTEPAKA